MPYPNKSRVFVASSAESQEQARQEVQKWARWHGYDFTRTERTFTIFRRDAPPREWVLLEQAANTRA